MFYVFLLFISATITVGLSIYSWRRRAMPGGAPFSVLMMIGSFWLVSIGLMLVAKTPDAAVIWYRVSLIGPAVMPIVLLVFVSRYSALDGWITPGRLVMLLILPLISMVLNATDTIHGWFFRSIHIAEHFGLMIIRAWSPGPWFMIHAFYCFGIAILAIVWLLIIAIRQFHRYRMQSIAVMAGSLAVVLPNIGFAFGLIPPDVIVLPFSFLFMGIFMSWGIFHHGLLDLVPVARNKLIDMMSDGMIVLDSGNRVVDINPAALHAIRGQFNKVIGKTVDEVFRHNPEIAQRFNNLKHTQTEFIISREGKETHYDVRIGTLSDNRAPPAGRLILFRDITDFKNQQEALQQAKNRADEALRIAELSRNELELKNVDLEKLNRELKSAMDKINRLEGILPICSFCKKIRDDRGGWNQLERFISDRSQADFSHSVCPDCAAKYYPKRI